MNVPTILQALLDNGVSQTDLATLLGTTQQSVSRWLRGEREPSGQAMLLIQELALDAGILPDKPTERPQTAVEEQHSVPVMGFIGAGAQVDPDHEQVPVDGFYHVELSFDPGEGAIAFEVKGPSMKDAGYRAGDVVVARSDPRRSAASLVGEEAAVRTYEGKRYLKTLMLGSKPHTYTLVSANAVPIPDQRLAWVSEIVAIVRAGQVRLVPRRRAGMPKASNKRLIERRPQRGEKGHPS
jgi:SOS-response transcriptional repressor LexA